jgi:hypothetical protein
MTCCLGLIPLRKTSNTWPENSAYHFALLQEGEIAALQGPTHPKKLT